MSPNQHDYAALSLDQLKQELHFTYVAEALARMQWQKEEEAERRRALRRLIEQREAA